MRLAGRAALRLRDEDGVVQLAPDAIDRSEAGRRQQLELARQRRGVGQLVGGCDGLSYGCFVEVSGVWGGSVSGPNSKRWHIQSM